MATRLQALLVVAGLLAAWELVSRLALVNPKFLPPPTEVLEAWRRQIEG